MVKTKALNVFKAFCMMICILVILALIALGIVNFNRLPVDVQIGIGLIIVIMVGTWLIYSMVYGDDGYSIDYDDYSNFEDPEED